MSAPDPAPLSEGRAPAIRVALLGFSTFERNALAGYLRLTQSRTPRYTHAMSVDDATFVVADGDEPGVASLLRSLGRTADAVFVGAMAPSGAAGWLMRPVDPAQVVRELDQLIAKLDQGAGPGAPTSEFAASAPALFDPLASGALPARPGAEPEGPRRRAEDSGAFRTRRRSARLDLDLTAAPPGRVPHESAGGRVLVVDDSEIARHFLRRELMRYGVAVDTASDSDTALALLAECPCDLVFLDIDLGPQSTLDGFSLCHRIRHLVPAPGRAAPPVVLVTAFHQPADKVRATLAGAEAVLGKPLDFPALERLMRRHGHYRAGVPRRRSSTPHLG